MMNFKILIGGLLIGLAWFLIPKGVLAAGASLSLMPATKTAAVGGTFNVDVVLDTGGQAVSSVSAIITYDSLFVSPVIVPGTSLALGKSTVAAGTITLATKPLAPNFTGSTTMATINMKTLKAGTTPVTIVFTGATTGSSVVLGTNGITNILNLVNSGVYTIGAGSETATGSAVPTTGAVENMMMILVLGVIFLGVGSMGVLWNFRKN